VPSEIRYLNTDLDVVSAFDLEVLVKALEERQIFSLHSDLDAGAREDGQWYATFETTDQYAAPEETICHLLDAIEALPANAQQLWSKCGMREFNIGYDCGNGPWAFNNGLSNRTLVRLGNAGAALKITIYPAAGEL
jgi:hypothetical protein